MTVRREKQREDLLEGETALEWKMAMWKYEMHKVECEVGDGRGRLRDQLLQATSGHVPRVQLRWKMVEAVCQAVPTHHGLSEWFVGREMGMKMASSF